MAEASPVPVSSPSFLPQKRPLHLDDKNAPSIASPLNPDPNARGRTREERTKKPTAKARKESPEVQTSGKKSKKPAKVEEITRPTRYRIPQPKPVDFEAPKPPLFVPNLSRNGRQYHEAIEHLNCKRGFRYSTAIADPTFPSSLYHRSSDTEPYGARMSYEDASSHVLYGGSAITTEKGFRMARANVAAREGRWYWECKILSGIKPPDQFSADGSNADTGGHVRIGWARREASLDGPVGFDAYSYGLRDVSGQKVHMSRPKDFANNSDFCEGDVIGLEIVLPSLSLHRKVMEGVYNKAVDVSDDLDPSASGEAPDIIRDRVPVRYRAHLYFEQYEYHPTKDLEELMHPSTAPTNNSAAPEADPPNPNHPHASLRTLPLSRINIYKNGELIGTPFDDLLGFLPPASKPLTQVGAREGLDDGMLGYYPAVSVFRGGAAETNFGPDFWFPPPELTRDEDVEMGNTIANNDQAATPHIAGAKSRLRPMSERFNEQVAEDIVYDILDEVDFWALDGGEAEGAMKGLSETGSAVIGPEGAETVATDAGGILSNGMTGVMKDAV